MNALHPLLADAPPALLAARRRAGQARAHNRAGAPTPWYQIRNEATDTDGDGVPEILIYGYIGYDWMPEDVTAYQFVRDLAAIDAPEISVRINSPGGFTFDGIVIYNALRDHRATVNVTVDGLAASAASFIAMAGDTITMNRASEMMIHDAWGLIIGNAADMRDAADYFDKHSTTLASIYAARAGGSVESWREVMQAETWFSADEAVAAGLADRAIGSDEAATKATAKASADLAGYRYQGRATAPAPTIPTSVAPEAAPASPAADEAEGDRVAARLRAQVVATQARAALALTSTPSKGIQP